MIPAKAERIDMLDRRVFWSTDNWTTVFVQKPDDETSRRLTGRAADRARFLAIAQAHGGTA